MQIIKYQRWEWLFLTGAADAMGRSLPIIREAAFITLFNLSFSITVLKQNLTVIENVSTFSYTHIIHIGVSKGWLDLLLDWAYFGVRLYADQNM